MSFLMLTDLFDQSQLSELLSEKAEILGQVEILDESDFRFSYIFTRKIENFTYHYKVIGAEARIICLVDLDSLTTDIKDKVLVLICFSDFSSYSDNDRYSYQIWKGEKLINPLKSYDSLVSNKGLRLEVVSRPCLINSTELAINELSAIAELFTRWFECEVLDTFSLEDEEGALSDVNSVRYERSKKNRDMCIKYHGVECVVCLSKLSDTYGDIAKNFIHIHHLTRLCDSGRVMINPIKDLVPVCPNCHSIIHLRVPPYSPKELRSALDKNRN